MSSVIQENTRERTTSPASSLSDTHIWNGEQPSKKGVGLWTTSQRAQNREWERPGFLDDGAEPVPQTAAT